MAIYNNDRDPNDQMWENQRYNPYIDINGIDRTSEIEELFKPTLEDIQNDPEFYAELVNDLMHHWMYGTRETPLMVMAKNNHKEIIEKLYDKGIIKILDSIINQK